MDKNAKIYVAGHCGLVGSALVRKLIKEGYSNLVLRTSGELDLRDQEAVAGFFREKKPDYVFLAAAKVGGIAANDTYPAEFIYNNLMIQTNIIHESYIIGVKRLLFLGSTCVYPKMVPQPIQEDYLLTGPLEPTNEAYAIAKISGIKMCQSYNRQYGTLYLAAMPTNLYGPNDDFDLEKSHVLPALMRKMHEAKSAGAADVVVWGTGNPNREFLHVDDLADGCLFLMRLPDEKYRGLLTEPVAPALVNIGSGEELTIRELALLIKQVVGFEGDLLFDVNKPDGTPRKLSDVSRLRVLGWKHAISLAEGLRMTYEWYLQECGKPEH